MEQGQVILVMQDAVYTVLQAALPLVAVGLVIGVIISIFQAATQINEQTLTFVPKIIGILLALLVFGGFILTVLTQFGERTFDYINQFVIQG